jgi:hypothetical protein
MYMEIWERGRRNHTQVAVQPEQAEFAHLKKATQSRRSWTASFLYLDLNWISAGWMNLLGRTKGDWEKSEYWTDHMLLNQICFQRRGEPTIRTGYPGFEHYCILALGIEHRWHASDFPRKTKIHRPDMISDVKEIRQAHSQTPSLLSIGSSSFESIIIIDYSSRRRDLLFSYW